MIDNLNEINNKGIRKILNRQKRKYIKGKNIYCIHDKKNYDLK